MKNKIGRIDGRGNFMRKNLKVLLLSVIVAATMIPISAFADTTADAAMKNGWVTENGSKYYYVVSAHALT